jgi:hypothetical protein
VDSDIELGTNDQTDLSIEGLTDNNGKKENTHEKIIVPKRGRPKKNKPLSESVKSSAPKRGRPKKV